MEVAVKKIFVVVEKTHACFLQLVDESSHIVNFKQNLEDPMMK